MEGPGTIPWALPSNGGLPPTPGPLRLPSAHFNPRIPGRRDTEDSIPSAILTCPFSAVHLLHINRTPFLVLIPSHRSPALRIGKTSVLLAFNTWRSSLLSELTFELFPEGCYGPSFSFARQESVSDKENRNPLSNDVECPLGPPIVPFPFLGP